MKTEIIMNDFRKRYIADDVEIIKEPGGLDGLRFVLFHDIKTDKVMKVRYIDVADIKPQME